MAPQRVPSLTGRGGWTVGCCAPLWVLCRSMLLLLLYAALCRSLPLYAAYVVLCRFRRGAGH